MSGVKVFYFSDVLCVWAYAAQIRLDQICKDFGDQVDLDMRFCSVFPDAHSKISQNWQDRGGFKGFNTHLQGLAERFEHITLNKDLWLDVKPRTSASGHLFLKAVQLVEADGEPPVDFSASLYNKVSWALRRAFFEQGRDISNWQIHHELCDELGIDYAPIDEKIRSSEAVAHLAVDYQMADNLAVVGSPTFVMNDGRQKLFGNVGYRLIEANIQEFLRKPGADEASWC